VLQGHPITSGTRYILVAFLYSHVSTTKSADEHDDGDTGFSADGHAKRKFAELENDAA
jgi:hypothetical protein